MCTSPGKRKYSSFIEAQEALKAMIKRGTQTSKGYLKPFRCEDHFHLGSGVTKEIYGPKKEKGSRSKGTTSAPNRFRFKPNGSRLVRVQHWGRDQNQWSCKLHS